jgi:hypothetical protein
VRELQRPVGQCRRVQLGRFADPLGGFPDR